MTTRHGDHAGDEAIRHAWRDTARDLPPERVDAAILAAARAALDDAKVAPLRRAPAARRQPWQPLLAAAAVAVVAFALLQVLPREPDRAPSLAPAVSTRDVPWADAAPAEARAPAASPPAPDATPAADSAYTADSATSAPATTTQTPPAEIAPVAPAPTEARAAEAAAAVAESAGAAAARSVPPPAPYGLPEPSYAAKPASRAEAGRAVPDAAASTAPAASADEAAALLARIVESHARGDRAAAAAALRRLRLLDGHADERLPPELRAWALTVP